MIKSSDIKEHLFLYCSSGWWWVSNTIRLLWIHLEESRNSSEYARHTYVYEQTWIYTQSAFHMLMLIQQTANWKNNTRKKSFPESSKKKNLNLLNTGKYFFYISFTLNLKLFAWYLHCTRYYTEKAMAPHCSTLARKIPWMEEPGRLQSMGSGRVRQKWATSLSLFTFMHWRRKWQPTPAT